jgi:hypothetical protein
MTEYYVKRWNYTRTGKVLTRSVKSLIRDFKYDRLDPKECLIDGLTEIAECLISQDPAHNASLEVYETRFGDLVLYLSSTGLNVDPYVQIHESLFTEIRRKMREETFESPAEPDMDNPTYEDDTKTTQRYNLKTRKDKEKIVEFQARRVKGIFGILKKIYHECGPNLVDSDGNIISPRFKEVWDNFQDDLIYLEKQGQDVSQYRGRLEELFGEDRPINFSGINLQGAFISGVRSPDLSQIL